MNKAPNPRLHHCCHNITTGSLALVLEMFDLLNCPVVYQPDNGYPWAMVGQEQLDFAIQITEISDKPMSDLDIKRQTHIAFISDDPGSIISKIQHWADSKDIVFRQDGWSEKEMYFDLPEIFVNFVVEIMHSSIEEE